MMDRIGLRMPIANWVEMDSHYDDDSGMEYWLYREDDGDYLLGACHVDVGQMTYYRGTIADFNAEIGSDW